MDIKQQTKNVAAQGRYGDSMLLHVNPAEVKGLASAVPLTVNPKTGQPEAFLPFLAPVLGSMLAPTLLAGTGLSAGAMAGIGAGLATYVQTGGSGSKALLSGLTAGMGTKALNTGAEAAIGNAASDAAIQSATTTGGQTAASLATAGETANQAAIQAAQEGSKLGFNQAGNFRGFTPGEALSNTFSGGFDSGAQALATGMMSPSGVAAGVGAGTQGVIASQEEFERQMAQMELDEEERKRKMYEMYPEQIPMASGGRTGFQPGGQTGYNYPAERDGYLDRFSNNSNYGGYNNPYQNSSNRFNTSRVLQRRTRPIGRGFMPGFMPEYSYFENMNPSATALGYDPLGNFQNPQSYQGGYNQSSRGRGGMFGRIFGSNRGGYRPQPQLQSSMQPPQFAGYGNPFMQSPSYQGFYGVPQMQQMLNPYARFTQQPMPYQPYEPYVPPVETPPDDDGTPPDDGGGTGGGDVPPILPPIDDGGGRKGAVKNVPPTAPVDDFTNPVVGGPVEPPIDGFKTLPYEPPVNYPGGTPPIVTPPPTITVPIEGGADVTIPDFSRPQPPRIEPPMSINRISNYDLDRRFDEVPISEPAPTDDMARLAPAQLASIGAPMSQSALDQQAAMSSLANNIDTGMLDPNTRIGNYDLERQNRGMVATPAPPVQSVTTPQPFLQKQYPKPVKSEAIEMTPVTRPNLNNEMETVNIGNYNLPSGPLPVTGPAQGERQIPSGPAMGGISAVPTPAAPPQNVGNNPPPMSIGGPGGIFGAPMFAAGGDTDLPNKGLEALSKTEKGREAVEAMGYQEGGQTDMMQDPVTQDVIMFILGETDNENAINAFVEKYGAEQFMFLRDKILKQAAGNPDAQTEGLIQGNGNSGMADDLPMNIGDKPIAAVSQDEYIIPADVVSMLGDGSSDAGSKQLDGMLDRVRQAKTGGKTQAPPLNPQKVMPA